MDRKSIIIFFIICLFAQGSSLTAEEAPDEEEKLLYLSEKAFSEQLYDIAGEKLEQFLEDYPDSQQKHKAQELLAKALYHLREYTRSAAILESLHEKSAEQEKKIEYLYWIGRNRLKQENFDAAVKAFDSVIAGNAEIPLRPYAKIEKAVCLFEMEKVDESFKILDEVITEFANKDQGTYAQLEKCRLLLARGEYSKARDGLLLLIDMKMPKELQSRMFFLLGEVEFYMNNLDEATAYYKKSLETGTYYDWYPEASYAIGWCRLKQGDHAKASKIFSSLAKEHEGSYIGWKSGLGIARALLLENKVPEAIENLEEIIAKASESPLIAEAKYLLGDAAIANKQYDEAIEYFDTMIRDYPESEFAADAYFGKAGALYIQKKYDESAAEFSKVIEHAKRPELVRAGMLRRADAYYEMREYIKALDEYKTIWKESSKVEEPERILLKMGWCYYKLEDYDSAIATFENLADKYSESDFADDAIYRIGGCCYRQGEFEKAIELYTELKKKFPKSDLLDKVDYQIGACHYHMGSYYLARQAYKEIVDKYPESILADRAAYEIGWCYYYEPGKADEAMDYFSSYIKEHPESAFAPEVLFWIGEQFYNGREFDRALAKFSELTEKYPKSFLADEGLYWSGRSAVEIAKPEKALAKFNELIEKFPSSEFAIDSAYRAAICSLDLGKTDESLEALLKLRSDTRSRYIENDIRLKIAESYIKLSKVSKAFAEYEKLSESRDRKFRAWGFYGMGLSYKEQKLYTKAISSFMEVAWNYSDEKEVVSLSYLDAGDCYAMLGKKREAIDRYIVVVEENLPHAEEARERINKLKRKSMLMFD